MEPLRPFAAFRWRSAAVFLLVAPMLTPLTGCRLCADCDEHAYAAYGGSWQRTRRDAGRVGSVFDPAGARAPDLVDRDEPPEIDTIQRERRREDEAPSEDEEAETPEEDEADLPTPEESLRGLQLEDI